jgi:hypothetical protein
MAVPSGDAFGSVAQAAHDGLAPLCVRTNNIQNQNEKPNHRRQEVR